MRIFPLAALALGGLVGCASVDAPRQAGVVAYASTFERVYERARQGDPESQNAAGVMLYRGDGVSQDRPRAREWFARAAQAGSERARRNLAFLEPAGDAGAPARRAEPGRAEAHYLRFCGGCHGLNGVAAYENSPSFAFGERLEKSDAALMRSLLEGRQEMPGWDDKLAPEDLWEILAFIRSLPARFDRGIALEPVAPAYMYLFGRMEERRRGTAP